MNAILLLLLALCCSGLQRRYKLEKAPILDWQKRLKKQMNALNQPLPHFACEIEQSQASAMAIRSGLERWAGRVGL